MPFEFYSGRLTLQEIASERAQVALDCFRFADYDSDHKLFISPQNPENFKVRTNPERIFVDSAVEATIGAVFPLTKATLHQDDTKVTSLENKNAGCNVP